MFGRGLLVLTSGGAIVFTSSSSYLLKISDNKYEQTITQLIPAPAPKPKNISEPTKDTSKSKPTVVKTEIKTQNYQPKVSLQVKKTTKPISRKAVGGNYRSSSGMSRRPSQVTNRRISNPNLDVSNWWYKK